MKKLLGFVGVALLWTTSAAAGQREDVAKTWAPMPSVISSPSICLGCVSIPMPS